jgi:hypothetical protein
MDDHVEDFIKCQTIWYEQILALRETNLFMAFVAPTFEKARSRVPYDSEQDTWHGPTASVWAVGYWAGLIGVSLLLNRRFPSEFRTIWPWLAAGHWPCGYDAKGRLLVL